MIAPLALRFSSATHPDAGRHRFTVQERALIQGELDQFRYGLAWDWLDNKEHLKCGVSASGKVVINPYRLGSSAKQGDCLGESVKVAKILISELGDRYEFFVVPGNFKGSGFQCHYYVLGWPKADARHCRQEVLDFQRIPPQALIIDPNFKRQGTFEELENYRYTVDINPEQGQDACIAGSSIAVYALQVPERDAVLSSKLPLGFVGELDPALSSRLNHAVKPEDLAYVQFRKSSGGAPPSAELAVTFAPGKDHLINWKRYVAPGSPLREVLELLEAKLSEENPFSSSLDEPPAAA